MNIRELWNSNNHKMWKEAEEEYQKFIPKDNQALEDKLAGISVQNLINCSTDDFYSFLYYDYFKWKYTAKNRLATTRKLLEYYKINNNVEELAMIKNALFSFDVKNTLLGLKIANLINGLGCAGASGLLSILFPEYFGTVDQFVVKSLMNTDKEKDVQDIKPDSIKLYEAKILEDIMINKAKELNDANNITYWTPRKIDKVLWSKGHI